MRFEEIDGRAVCEPGLCLTQQRRRQGKASGLRRVDNRRADRHPGSEGRADWTPARRMYWAARRAPSMCTISLYRHHNPHLNSPNEFRRKSGLRRVMELPAEPGMKEHSQDSNPGPLGCVLHQGEPAATSTTSSSSLGSNADTAATAHSSQPSRPLPHLLATCLKDSNCTPCWVPRAPPSAGASECSLRMCHLLGTNTPPGASASDGSHSPSDHAVP